MERSFSAASEKASFTAWVKAFMLPMVPSSMDRLPTFKPAPTSEEPMICRLPETAFPKSGMEIKSWQATSSARD